MRTRLAAQAVVLAGVAFWAGGALAAPQDPDGGAKDIVAAQIRSQGYQCDSPQSATRDQEASRPNETVWVLQCENATYQVTLVPNLAAKVEVRN